MPQRLLRLAKLIVAVAAVVKVFGFFRPKHDGVCEGIHRLIDVLVAEMGLSCHKKVACLLLLALVIMAQRRLRHVA